MGEGYSKRAIRRGLLGAGYWERVIRRGLLAEGYWERAIRRGLLGEGYWKRAIGRGLLGYWRTGPCVQAQTCLKRDEIPWLSTKQFLLLLLLLLLLLVPKVCRGGQILWYTEVTFHFRRRGGRAGGRRVGSPGGLAKGRTATVGLRKNFSFFFPRPVRGPKTTHRRLG